MQKTPAMSNMTGASSYALMYSVFQSLPISCRGFPVGLLEGIVKCSSIAEADVHGDLVYFPVGIQKQCNRVFQTDLVYIILEISAGTFLEKAAEIIGIHMYFLGKNIERQALCVVEFDILKCLIDILLIVLGHRFPKPIIGIINHIRKYLFHLGKTNVGSPLFQQFLMLSAAYHFLLCQAQRPDDPRILSQCRGYNVL